LAIEKGQSRTPSDRERWSEPVQKLFEIGKTIPDRVAVAAARIGVAPSEMLVLEDSEMGTRSAAAAGAVSVPHEHSRHHDFSTAFFVAAGLRDPTILRLLTGE
jgi:beta-phosphoglucomutase-like phosphatase (HAD superfamily)